MQWRGLKLRRVDEEAPDALMRRGRESVRVLKRARVLQFLAQGCTLTGAAEAAGIRSGMEAIGGRGTTGPIAPRR